MNSKKDEYVCEHCGKSYVNKTPFLAHQCRILHRKNEVKSIIGQEAFIIYKKWLSNKGTHNTEIDTFINSRYYNAFINFAKYLKSMSLPDIGLFYDFVFEKKIDPTLWTNSLVFDMYIKMIDDLNPLERVHISLKFLKVISEEFECDLDEVLVYMDIKDLIYYVQTRHLSPWLLLNCQSFKTYLQSGKINKFDLKYLEKEIKPEYWKERFINNPKALMVIRKVIGEIGL